MRGEKNGKKPLFFSVELTACVIRCIKRSYVFFYTIRNKKTISISTHFCGVKQYCYGNIQEKPVDKLLRICMFYIIFRQYNEIPAAEL